MRSTQKNQAEKINAQCSRPHLMVTTNGAAGTVAAAVVMITALKVV